MNIEQQRAEYNALAEKNMKLVERLANEGDKRYGAHLDMLRSCPQFKLAGMEFNEHHAANVTMLMDQQHHYLMNESQATISDLGAIPNVALDLIANTYGGSAATVLASTQAIQEEIGAVYYKETKFCNTRGTVNAGDVAFPGLGNMQHENDFASYTSAERKDEYTGTDTVAGTVTYAFTSDEMPLRKGKVLIVVENLPFTGYDNGNGLIAGFGMTGTVNYSTGAVSITLNSDPGAAEKINMSYQVDFELQDDIQSLNLELVSKSVSAHPYALKYTDGIFKNHTLSKRFGKLITEDMVQDLTAAMSATAADEVIKQYKAAYLKNKADHGIVEIEFDVVVPAGISDAEHRKDLGFKFTRAGLQMKKNAGKGTYNRILCGTKMLEYISSLDGWVKSNLDDTLGPYIAGTYKGAPVVHSDVMVEEEAILGWVSPRSPWEAPVVRVPYMALQMIGDRSNGKNPLSSQRAIAEMTGYESLNVRFTHKIKLIDSTP